MDIKLPKPLFQGTPKNIKPSPTLEKYNEKPRPPFYVPEGTTNLALRKPVTSSDIAADHRRTDDGHRRRQGRDRWQLRRTRPRPAVGPDRPRDAAEIYAIVVWHYHAEGRVYHDVVVQVADDPDFIENVNTVFNNDFDNSSGLGLGKHLEYIDDYRGKLVDVRDGKGRPARGRYVRLYSKGNTSNDLNHYVEVEVYGKAVPVSWSYNAGVVPAAASRRRCDAGLSGSCGWSGSGHCLCGLAVRLPHSPRPMHGDEANQAVRTGMLLETGRYDYDPQDHHGPSLYWLTLPVAVAARRPALPTAPSSITASCRLCSAWA